MKESLAASADVSAGPRQSPQRMEIPQITLAVPHGKGSGQRTNDEKCTHNPFELGNQVEREEEHGHWTT